MECILDKFLLAAEIFYSSKQITLENVISNMFATCSVANPLLTCCGLVTLYGNKDLGQHWLR